MSTSSILTTIQLDRSLFREEPEGALTVWSVSGGLDFGLDFPSREQRKKYYSSLQSLYCLLSSEHFFQLFKLFLYSSDFECWGKFSAHTLDCLFRGVLGWLGTLSLWTWEPRGVHPPLVLLQQFASPLGLSLHGSTVALPVSTAISCTNVSRTRNSNLQLVLQMTNLNLSFGSPTISTNLELLSF